MHIDRYVWVKFAAFDKVSYYYYTILFFLLEIIYVFIRGGSQIVT